MDDTRKYVKTLLDKAIKEGEVPWNGWHDGMRKALLELTEFDGKNYFTYEGHTLTIKCGDASFLDNAGTEKLVLVKNGLISITFRQEGIGAGLGVWMTQDGTTVETLRKFIQEKLITTPTTLIRVNGLLVGEQTHLHDGDIITVENGLKEIQC